MNSKISIKQMFYTALPYILCSVLITTAIISNAQTTVRYLNQSNSVTDDLATATKIQTFTFDSISAPYYHFEERDKNGQINRVGLVKHPDDMQFEGVLTTYKDGVKISEKNYKNNSLLGIANYYYGNGQLKKQMNYSQDPYREELISFFDVSGDQNVKDGNGLVIDSNDLDGYEKGEYKNGLKIGRWTGTFRYNDLKCTFEEDYEAGILQQGQTITSEGEKLIYTSPFQTGNFPKNHEEFRRKFGQLYKTPKEAKKAGVYGRLVINFVISKEGKLTNAEVGKDLGYGTAEEALRVIQLMNQDWEPARMRGIPVSLSFSMPVSLDYRK